MKYLVACVDISQAETIAEFTLATRKVFQSKEEAMKYVCTLPISRYAILLEAPGIKDDIREEQPA